MASLIGEQREDWLEALPPMSEPGVFARTAKDLRWVGAFFLPWIGRRITGRSSGDGRYAKRPELAPVNS